MNALTHRLDHLKDRLDDVPLATLLLRASIPALVLLCALFLTLLIKSPGWANTAQQAMLDDPALPFVAWDRAIAQAPTREARLVLVQAREDVIAGFEAPLWRAYLVPARVGDLLTFWRMIHQGPAQLFQTLGGTDAYRAAVRNAQEKALDQDAQARLDSGVVRRGAILAQAIPALVPAASR